MMEVSVWRGGLVGGDPGVGFRVQTFVVWLGNGVQRRKGCWRPTNQPEDPALLSPLGFRLRT